jgi:hypothetical protein
MLKVIKLKKKKKLLKEEKKNGKHKKWVTLFYISSINFFISNGYFYIFLI